MRILIYGDSNSWGYLDDGSGLRYDNRWPMVMRDTLRQQGHEIEMVEDCLPGRTTNTPDPQEGPQFDGALPLLPVVMAHQPLDHVIIMLGTNDLKARFKRDAADISDGLMHLVTIIRASNAGPGGWAATNIPSITIICPPMLGDRADDPAWVRYDEWRGGLENSQLLPSVLATACANAKVHFINGNHGASSSMRDPIHWNAETHHNFGAFMADQFASIVVS